MYELHVGLDDLYDRTRRIEDREVADELRRVREWSGDDRFDEVWKGGVYVIPPARTHRHLAVVGQLASALRRGLSGDVAVHEGAVVAPGSGTNGWRDDYRVPDVAVARSGRFTEDGGRIVLTAPALVFEVRAPEDDGPSHKLPFYARAGVGEVVILGREQLDVVLWRSGSDGFVAVPSTEGSVRSVELDLEIARDGRLAPGLAPTVPREGSVA